MSEMRADRCQIAEASVRESRVIVTKDGDFDPPKFGERVVRLRVGHCSTSELLEWLDIRLDAALERIVRGEACVDIN